MRANAGEQGLRGGRLPLVKAAPPRADRHVAGDIRHGVCHGSRPLAVMVVCVDIALALLLILGAMVLAAVAGYGTYRVFRSSR